MSWQVRLTTGSNAPANYQNLIRDVTVSTTDDETPHIVLSETELAVIKGTSPTATYMVALGTQSTGGVEMQIARSAAYYVLNKAGGAQAINQDLTFTTGNWNTGQAITVIALNDDDALAGTSNITPTTVDVNTAAEYDSVPKNLPPTVTDDDAALVVSRGTGALALMEGSAETYTVTLKGQPSGNMVVDVTSDDAGAVAVRPGSLTYGTANWNTAQTVTATAVADNDENAETATVTPAVNDGASADEFDPADDVSFTVNVTDNDTPGLAVSATDLTTNGETEGSTATYTVALATLPTGPVTVSSNNADVPADVDGDASNGARRTLTFTTTTWETRRR